MLLSRPSSPERRRVSHALARPALFSAADSGSNLRLLLYFLSWLVFCWHDAHTRHQMKALVSRLRHAKVSPFRRRASSGCQGRRHQEREKHLGKSSRECETRRLEVSDGSLCPNLKWGGGEALCIAFQHSSYRFFFCQLALTEAAAETSGIVFWQRDRVHHINPG